MCVKSKKKLILTILLSIVISISAAANDDRNHKKRQIYREQVLPHAGGRIPDTAFETDRLFLNRLQKEGIAVPDGVVLEQRNPQVYPFQNREHRTVFRIALSSDARFISKEGRYQYNEVPTIETTYLYPQIHGEKSITTPMTTVYPAYRQIQLHNSQINQLKFQSKKKDQYPLIASSSNKASIKPLKTTSYQNFNIIHNTLNRPAATSTTMKTNFLNSPTAFFDSPNRHYLPSYESENFFNDFNHYFNNFDLYHPNAGGGDFFNKEHIIDLPATGFSSSPDQLLY